MLKKIFCIVFFLGRISAWAQENGNTAINNSADTLLMSLHSVIKVNRSIDYENELIAKEDSVSLLKRIAECNHKVLFYKDHLINQVDSLKQIENKDGKVLHAIDSLNSKLDSVSHMLPITDIKKAEQQLSKLKVGINSSTTNLSGEINQRIGVLNSLKINSPSINIPSVNFSGLKTKMQNVTGVNNAVNNSVTQTLEKESMTDLSKTINVNEINLLKNPKLISNDLLTSGSISKIEGDGSDISRTANEIKTVEANLKSKDLNNLSKTVESDLENTDAMKQLKQQSIQMEQYKKMANKWQSDPEYQKELILNKAKEQAVNHFEGHDRELMAAVQRLTNVKLKYKDFEGSIDLFRKSTNPMKQKPFLERIRPGFTLQVQSKYETLININPQVGYRVSGRLTAGLGWNERFGFDIKKKKYISNDWSYGPQAYLQVKLRSGIYGLTVPEVMSMPIASKSSLQDENSRKWVWSYLIGMKKEFQSSRGAIGNIQALYNVYAHHNSPYVNKLVIRIGFEFPLLKNDLR